MKFLLVVCFAWLVPFSLMGEMKTAFAPGLKPVRLIGELIASAEKSVDLAAYLFTNPKVRFFLLQALEKKVQVRVLLDAQVFRKSPAKKKTLAFLAPLKAKGASIRLEAVGGIFHHKFILVDQKSLQTGSFNYTLTAERQNNENVLVLYNEPQVAKDYQQEFDRLWLTAKPLQEIKK